ncbi:MAG: insulinase family protein [Candidatus Eremiobacteraeota bacterium]|nr:insulinase family protein [Candidatus Eremiobacteraeota bacterium]
MQQNDASSLLTGIQIFVSAGLDRQAAAQNGIAALVAECLVRSSPSLGAAALRADVAAQGGSISYEVDGRYVRFYLEGTTQDFAGLMTAFAAALRHPDFNADSVTRARNALDLKITEDQKLPLTVGLEIVNAATFSNSGEGLPQYGTAATLAGITSADVQAFFRTNYRRDGAVLSAVGNLGSLSSNNFADLLDTLPLGTSQSLAAKIAPLGGTSHRVVARRDIGIPWIVAGFPAPSPDSRDFGAMLLLASVVEDMLEGQGVTTRPVSERAFGALYNFDQRPANFVIYANGASGDPSKTLATVFSVLNVFSHGALNKDALQRTKTVAIGSFANGAVTLEDRSWLAGSFVIQGLRPNYLERAFDAIANTSAIDVARVGKRYLQNPTLAYVLPRNSTP